VTTTRTSESTAQDTVDRSRQDPSDSNESTIPPRGQAEPKLKGKDKFRKIATYTLLRASEKNLTQVASSLTFTTVLAVVPMLAVILSLFTAFPLFDDFRLALEDFLTSNLMPSVVSDNVMSYLNEFAAKASGLTAIGSLALIVTSVMLMRTIDDAFNNIWQVQKQRPLRQRVLVYWAILSLGPILLGASLWATSIFTRESLGYMDDAPGVLNMALSLVPLLITGFGFTALFTFVPNHRVQFRDALIGGIGTAIALEIMRIGFAYYLTRFPSYTIIYGAFATVPIFLLWIYMSWLAILAGATLVATLPALRHQHWAKQHYPGVAFVDAVSAIRVLWQCQGQTEPGLTLNHMASVMSVDQDDLQDVLMALSKLGYVVKTQDKQASRWVLACDPRTATLSPLVDALLIDRTQPHIEQVPYLPEAVALTLQNTTVLLNQLLETPESLSESTQMVQNSILMPSSASGNTEETYHAES
jgi:membrane protein